MENMILTSYSRKSYFLASIQMLLCDKFKHQVRGQFLSRDKFILSRDITFMSRRSLHHNITEKQINAAIDVFIV